MSLYKIILQELGAESISILNSDNRKNALGHQGIDANIHLILRIVADVGLIGLPNAGLSIRLAIYS